MSVFVCSKCNSQFPKWLGQCPECGAWGTITEQDSADLAKQNKKIFSKEALIKFNQPENKIGLKLKTRIEEMDRVLGGGMVPSSLILLGGEPGIGKSTLALQVAGKFSSRSVFYVSGEESVSQIQSRIKRLGIQADNLRFLGETDIDLIVLAIKQSNPILVVIDSIQTVSSHLLPSAAGTVNQIRVVISKLREAAIVAKSVILIIGQVTKEGAVAGPKTLEHLVDVVLYLDGDANQHFRFLRAVKNRFGSTQEIGVFDMKEKGLIEIKNPSEIFLANRNLGTSGSIIASIVEGRRSFLVEVQSLVSKTNFNHPQRKASGFDLNRLCLLIAVLVKRINLNLNNQDIHINIAGGIKVKEPAIDLGISLAIVSAFKNQPVGQNYAVFGEVGLAGEIRSVIFAEKRIRECLKMGFTKIICPLDPRFSGKKEIIQVKTLKEAVLQLYA
ncbi:DNA repair protein RadA [Candidatus Parcubacteria bacterium 4484_255]|nr:MAG: DNA repair protein RadA [Candidatus Parcubacteria bacterium 4484_255]